MIAQFRKVHSGTTGPMPAAADKIRNTTIENCFFTSFQRPSWSGSASMSNRASLIPGNIVFPYVLCWLGALITWLKNTKLIKLWAGSNVVVNKPESFKRTGIVSVQEVEAHWRMISLFAWVGRWQFELQDSWILFVCFRTGDTKLFFTKYTRKTDKSDWKHWFSLAKFVWLS